MTKFALCIGINDYPGTDSDLAGCVNDANDWAAAFAKRGLQRGKDLRPQGHWGGIRTAIQNLMAKAKKRRQSHPPVLRPRILRAGRGRR